MNDQRQKFRHLFEWCILQNHYHYSKAYECREVAAKVRQLPSLVELGILQSDQELTRPHMSHI